MSVLGIIAEYNPFHRGHLYHLSAARELTRAESVVAVMSGNFVQRGEPAFCDKHSRTLMALKGGADAVLELPAYFAASAAGDFAEAAVTLLEKTGVVDCLCFGSEGGGLAEIEAARNLLDEDGAFRERLRASLKKGAAYPAAFGAAAKGASDGSVSAGGSASPDGGASAVFEGPNGTLGALYLNALRKLSSHITPYTIKRADFASAGEIRAAARNGGLRAVSSALPSFSREILSNYAGAFPSLDDYSLLFQYLTKTAKPEYLQGILGMDEGLHNRFTRFGGEYSNLGEILDAVKTRRYTYTRIQRAALHVILGITKADFAAYKAAGGPQYIRVLGFRREKAALLGEIEKKACLPMIVNIKDARKKLTGPALRMLDKEIQTTDIYNLARGASGKGAEFRTGPVIV